MNPVSLEYNPDFLKEEVREGYFVTSEMKTLWLFELDIVNKFKQVCDKYGLTYFADSGTLLGAVRHNGFIPWDDDVDLIMMRKDFDKFREVVKDEFKYPYFVEWGIKRPGGFLMKIWRVDTTRILEKNVRKYISEAGSIFIDIFCLDYGPETREEQLSFYNELLKIENEYTNEKMLYHKKYHSRLVPDSHIKKSSEKLTEKYNEFDLACQKYNDTTFLFNDNFINYHLKDGLMRYTEDYNETVDLPFEMLTLKCPKGYERILDIIYTQRTGISWNIPTQNLSYHNQTDKYLLDFDNPSTKYIKRFYNRPIDYNRIPRQ